MAPELNHLVALLYLSLIVRLTESLAHGGDIAAAARRKEATVVNRREALLLQFGGLVALETPSYCLARDIPSRQSPKDLGAFVYSSTWTGTDLPLLSLAQSVQEESLEPSARVWYMGRWPDPILRRPAEPVPAAMLGTDTLQRACKLLQMTAEMHGAVGLAAQQCGVNARIIYLQRPRLMTLVNPRIVQRSPELEMRVWREECLVLPPTFRATVLRDAWVDVAYQRPSGNGNSWEVMRLSGEAARALQHEYDHDRGILITDHVDLQELETAIMQSIEKEGHDLRMLQAYERATDDLDDGAMALSS